MSGFSIFWRTRPLLRNVLLIGSALVVLATGLCVSSSGSRTPSASHPPAAPQIAETPAPTDEPSASAVPELPPSTQDAARNAALEASRTTAIAFLEAYSSYRWDDPPDATRKRVRPFDTDAFDKTLATNSGAGAARAGQTAHKEVAIGRVTDMTAVGLGTDGKLSVNALLRLDVTSDPGGSHSVDQSVGLILVHKAAGWRVEDVKA